MKDKEKYYPWVCPKCGDSTCRDPLRIVCTVCSNGHEVYLCSFVKPDGTRVAFKREGGLIIV